MEDGLDHFSSETSVQQANVYNNEGEQLARDRDIKWIDTGKLHALKIW